MRKPVIIVAVVVLIVAAIAAVSLLQGGDSQESPPAPSSETPTPGVIPSATPLPTPAPSPTPAGPFLPQGYTAPIEGQSHGVSGEALVAADRQILLRGFSYDGKGQDVDIRLIREASPDQPLAVLMKLEGALEKTAVLLEVPSDVPPDEVEAIAIYSEADSSVYGVGVFGAPQEPTPTSPPPTPTGGEVSDSPVATPSAP